LKHESLICRMRIRGRRRSGTERRTCSTNESPRRPQPVRRGYKSSPENITPAKVRRRPTSWPRTRPGETRRAKAGGMEQAPAEEAATPHI